MATVSKDATIKMVQDLAAVVNDPKFAAVIGDLVEAEAKAMPLMDQAMKDAKAHLVSQGVKLPPNATVKITKNSPVRVQVCVDSHCVTISVGVFE